MKVAPPTAKAKGRSESDIVTMAPIKVTLGKYEFAIPVLTLTPSREWRQKVIDMMGPVLQCFKAELDGKAFMTGLTAAYLTFPDKLLELMYAYDLEGKLDHKVIEGEATDEQINTAFSKVMVVAYPFLAQLGTMAEVMRATTEE